VQSLYQCHQIYNDCFVLYNCVYGTEYRSYVHIIFFHSVWSVVPFFFRCSRNSKLCAHCSTVAYLYAGTIGTCLQRQILRGGIFFKGFFFRYWWYCTIVYWLGELIISFSVIVKYSNSHNSLQDYFKWLKTMALI